MREIELTRGKIAKIDDADFLAVSKFKWHAFPWHTGRGWYARTSFSENGKQNWITLHRFLMPGVPRIDHKNGDGLDCRRKNLRPASRLQNAANRRKTKLKSTSRFKGVNWHKAIQKWVASIQFCGKKKHIGCFASEKLAARAYNYAAIELFGEFAQTNNI